MRVAIIGFGREGESLLKFLRNRRLTRTITRTSAKKNIGINQLNRRKSAPFEIWVLDKNPCLKLPIGIKTRLGKNYLKNLEQFDIIFRSPGVPYNLPELVRARKHGVKFSSATKLFFETFPTRNIIGITGTKGKGTTATLLYKILKEAFRRRSGHKVFLAGNIGKPALDILPKIGINQLNRHKSATTIVVLELSSFQLQDLKKSPRIAVILDVFPDHQDSHLSLKEYYDAKAAIARRQKRSDKIFYFADSPKSAAIAAKSRGKKIAVSPFSDASVWWNKIKSALRLPGRHNFKNAVMAASVALSLGVSKKIILKTIKNFRGLPHRLELVRTITAKPARPGHSNIKTKYHPGILKYLRIMFYNDSASTNPHATAAAIRAFPNQPKILIAGGEDKGLDYRPLAQALKNSNTKLVVLYGENKNKIAKALAKIKSNELRIRTVGNLRSAVAEAYKFALRLPTTYYLLPTVILLSPGSASFDQFKNYADRGEQFKKIVKALK